MPIFTVHQPAESSGDPDREAERIVFIREGFCWPALYLTFVWALSKRLWLIAFGFIAVVVLAEALVQASGIPASGLAAILTAFLFALEANNLWRWTLSRRGWTTVGIAAGTSRDDCETRFFDAWNARPGPEPVPPAATSPAPAIPTVSGGDVLGVFPTSERPT